MFKNIFKFMVTTLTILTLNLLTTEITAYLISYKTHYKPITFSLIAMGIITLVFYPLFIKLEDWVNKLTVKVVRSGKSIGGRYLGIIIMYFICLAVLLYFYTKMWFHIDLVRLLFQGHIGSHL